MNFDDTQMPSYGENKMMDNMMSNMGGCCMNTPNNMCMPIYECPEEKVCHRYICYEVPQE